MTEIPAKLDSTGKAVVSPKVKWLPITKDTPRGAPMFLISRAAGRAQVDILSSTDTFYTHWHPMPTFSNEEQEAP